MPLNPQAKMILDQMASLNLPPLWEQSAEDARAAPAARRLPRRSSATCGCGGATRE